MSNTGAPTFDLILNGRQLSADQLRHVISMELVESMDELDALTVQLAVPAASDEVLSLVSHGVAFEVRLGYGGETIRHVQGDIIEVTHQRSASMPWVVTLRGLDNLHRLKKAPRSKVWHGSHAEIATLIASEHQLTPIVEGVEGSPTYEFQSNVSDAEFLLRLARENNYFVRVQGNILRFGRRNTAFSGMVSACWGEDLIELSVTQSMDDIPTSVVVKGWDYTQNCEIIGQASIDALSIISGGASGAQMVLKAFGNFDVSLDNAVQMSTSNANTRAKAELQRRAEQFAQGNLLGPGRPEACSGGMLKLSGAGPVSGNYLIKQTRHTLEPGAGYQTAIDFISDSLPSGAS